MGWHMLESGLRNSVTPNLCFFEALAFWVLIFKLIGYETNLSLNTCWDPSLKCSLEVTVVVTIPMQAIVQSPIAETTQGHHAVTFCFSLFMVSAVKYWHDIAWPLYPILNLYYMRLEKHFLR